MISLKGFKELVNVFRDSKGADKGALADAIAQRLTKDLCGEAAPVVAVFSQYRAAVNLLAVMESRQVEELGKALILVSEITAKLRAGNGNGK